MAITVRDLIDKLRLKVVYGNESLFEKEITTADISRPGLEMTGCFEKDVPAGNTGTHHRAGSRGSRRNASRR